VKPPMVTIEDDRDVLCFKPVNYEAANQLEGAT